MNINDGFHVEATFYFYYSGQLATNRRAWKWVAGVPGQPTDTTHIDTALGTIGIQAAYGAVLTNAAVLQGIRYVPLPNPGRIAPIYSDTLSATGSGGAVALPKQTSGLIKFKSLTLGKRGEGRVYLPFPPTAANETTGVPTAGYIASALSLSIIFATNISCNSTTGSAGTLQPVLIPGPSVLTPPVPVSSSIPSHAWATQRRRGDYGRLNKSPF